MGSGTGSTLVINPEGLSSLTMGLQGSEPYTASSPYIVPLQTLDWNEETRWQIVYGQASSGEGGEVIGGVGPLVPVAFQIIIKATTRAAMIEAYNDLQAALLNRKGGTIQYKPEDVGAGVLSTYYHYLQSKPPRLLDVSGNRWDAPQTCDGMYTLYVEVEFLTQPIATSDPDNPVTLSDLAATIQNWVDSSPSQTNRVTVQASNLKGTMPALLRFLARPGSGQNMGRLIVFLRSEGTLSNFVNLYEAEDGSVIYPSVAWTEVVDSDRGDGAYMRCLPPEDANGMAQGLRFTISNPGDHEGRFVVFGIGYDDADETGVWTHQAKLVCGNITQAGDDDHEAVSLHNWQFVYAGEFELPPTPMSGSESGYDAGPYVEWYSTRANGTSEFRLDAILLVFVADSEMQPCALDVPCEDEFGVVNSEELLVENLVDEYGVIRELAHVVAQSDGDFKRILATAPRGDFLTLDPTRNHLLVFAQERYNGTILEDDFEDYIGDRWALAATFEQNESWFVPGAWEGSNGTTYAVEGTYTARMRCLTAETYIWMWAYKTLDLSSDGRFGDTDFIAIFVYMHSLTNVQSITFDFMTTDSDYYSASFAVGELSVGRNYLYRLRGSFGSTGSPDWSNITKVAIRIIASTSTDQLDGEFDYARIEKADPNNPGIPNATGSIWDFQPSAGVWTITEDITGAGATMACLDIESGVEKSALIDETLADAQFRARVMAKRDAGYTGILWRAGDDTLGEGFEDCYAALLDIANDKLLVREYTSGSITQHDNPDFTCAVDTWYVVGVIAKGSTFRVYATAASNLSDDDDVFDESYLLSTVTDSTLTTGKCGVMSISTLGRFDDVKLTSLQDKVIPADEITLEGKAIFRTIAPFCE